MPKVIVLLTADDIMAFENGEAPNEFFERDFATQAEAKAYRIGVESMNDLVDYEVMKDDGSKTTVKIGTERITIEHRSVEVKSAYLKGLEDGDGYRSPAIYDEDDFDFDDVVQRIAGSPTGANP